MGGPERSGSGANLGALARRVRMRMAELGFDQQSLAQAAGISAQVVRDLQRGKYRRYRPATLAKVARALGWAPVDLLRILSDSQEGRDHTKQEPD